MNESAPLYMPKKRLTSSGRKLKILIHSKCGDSAGLAHRFKAEGHSVEMYIDEKACKASGENMIDHVPSMLEGIKKKPDLILFDREGNGALADRLKKAGLNVCCASALADKMELDRGFGMELMEKNGIRIPETEHFDSLEAAKKYIEKNPQAYAIKMDGNKGAASSYVADDPKEMLDYLNYQDEMGLIGGGAKFVLQRVVKGAEVSTEVWFCDGEPIQPFNSTFENKKFMPGDLGPNTGCETSVVFPYRNGSKMVQKTIAKIFPFLEKEKWTGPLDINCIISEKDHEPYALEWTVRLGYSAVYAWAAMIEDGIGEFFFDLANGTLKKINVKHPWGTALRVSIPPYPYDNPDEPELEKRLFEETAGQRITVPNSKQVWLLDAKKDDKDRLVTAGIDGTIGECTGVGNSLQAAWRVSQTAFGAFEVPNKQGRLIDGIESPTKRINRMRSWGYSDIPSPR